MKKMIAILAVAMLLWGASASADTLDFLKPFWMQMMDGVSNTASGKIPENVTVTCTDERLTVEACGVLLENDYSTEAHVYAVLKNTGSERLPIRSVQMTVLGANRNTLHQENYVSYMPSVVEPGETMLVSEWMYDFVKEIGEVDSIRISVDLGVAPGSSIVWRKQLEDAATLKIGTDAVCKAWAYWMEDL